VNCREASYGFDQRVEVLGSRGMAISENPRRHNMVISANGYTGRGSSFLNFFIERYREAFAAEISAFVDAVETGRPPAVGFEDGRQALILAEAALKSAVEHRSVRTEDIVCHATS
jgi:myo-inositol 2-dehydrogenase / D-chiro-inositol 1-dehydrogenase